MQNHTHRIGQRAALVAACSLVLIVGCGQSSADPQDVFVKGSESAVIDVIQENTNPSNPDREWLKLLKDIWYERAGAHPDFAWEVLKQPRVKVTVASQLAQSYRNGLVDIDVNELRKFAEVNLSSTDNRVVRDSIVLIGELGNQSDVQLLVNLARNGVNGKRVLRDASIALNFICGDDARSALESIGSELSGDDAMHVSALLNNRAASLGPWCKEPAR